LPAATAALAVLGLAVDWLTSGGIGFPGVAAVFWLLLVVGLNAAPSGDCPNFCASKNGAVPFRIASTHTMPRACAFFLLAVVMGVGAAAYWSDYAPVLYCQTDMQRARAAIERRMPSALLLKSAAGDDPWDARPWRQLAEQTFAQWSAHPDATAYAEFEDYLQKALAREPNLALAWKRAGDNYLAAFAKTQRPSDAAKAIEHYRRAVELYPNNGLFHGQLALAYTAAADPVAAQRAAAEALRLDALTPHGDRKLGAVLAAQLRVLAEGER
jgi:tetratricopeptide (TPR) repeat protein